MFSLPPPRHIPTLPQAPIKACPRWRQLSPKAPIGGLRNDNASVGASPLSASTVAAPQNSEGAGLALGAAIVICQSERGPTRCNGRVRGGGRRLDRAPVRR